MKSLLEDIDKSTQQNIRKLNKMLTLDILPGQRTMIEQAEDGLRWWRNTVLKETIKEFEK